MKYRKSLIAMTIAATLATTPLATAAPKITVKAAGRTTATILNTMLSGPGIPTKTTGIDGDFYIDTKNVNIYGPKTKGVWKLITSLKQPESKSVTTITGTQGAIGANGVQGEKGDKGATGNTGANGSAGLSGAAGAKGATGNDGATGATGFSGSTGSIGATGSVGATGAAGAKGDIGLTGPAGSNGTNGSNGADGAAGLAGAKGDTGTAGVKGDTGTAGSAGISVAKFNSFNFITFSTGTNGINGSSNFFTNAEAGNYTFEVLVSATIANNENLNFSGEIISGGPAIDNQFSISSSAIVTVSSTEGRRYSILITGVAANVTAGTSFGVRVTLATAATTAMSISFGGRALINKVGSIG